MTRVAHQVLFLMCCVVIGSQAGILQDFGIALKRPFQLLGNLFKPHRRPEAPAAPVYIVAAPDISNAPTPGPVYYKDEYESPDSKTASSEAPPPEPVTSEAPPPPPAVTTEAPVESTSEAAPPVPAQAPVVTSEAPPPPPVVVSSEAPVLSSSEAPPPSSLGIRQDAPADLGIRTDDDYEYDEVREAKEYDAEAPAAVEEEELTTTLAPEEEEEITTLAPEEAPEEEEPPASKEEIIEVLEVVELRVPKELDLGAEENVLPAEAPAVPAEAPAVPAEAPAVPAEAPAVPEPEIRAPAPVVPEVCGCREYTVKECTANTFEVCDWVWKDDCTDTEKEDCTSEGTEDKEVCETVQDIQCSFKHEHGVPPQPEPEPQEPEPQEPDLELRDDLNVRTDEPLVYRRARHARRARRGTSFNDVVDDQGDQVKLCRQWTDENGVKQECHEISQPLCQRVDREECKTVQVPVCKTVKEQDCVKVQEPECNTVNFFELKSEKQVEECQIQGENGCQWPETRQESDDRC